MTEQKHIPENFTIPPGVDLVNAGYETGKACQLFLQGFFQGMADAMEDAALLDAAVNTTIIDSKQDGKDDFSDCRNCWCNECADIEQCDVINFPEAVSNNDFQADRPHPCRGCENRCIGQPKAAAALCGVFVKGSGTNYL
jgi:hypothetical protein